MLILFAFLLSNIFVACGRWKTGVIGEKKKEDGFAFGKWLLNPNMDASGIKGALRTVSF